MQRARVLRVGLPTPVASTAVGRRVYGAALLLAAAALLLAPPSQAQTGLRAPTVRFVDADAAPGGDGLSWPTAFDDLQDALAAAQPGDEVWIAEGLYTPTEGSDRTATFALASGVALYGGFDGTETEREERDWTLHASVLSGDVGVPSDEDDNAYHVVTAPDTDPATTLDGLIVEWGRANATTAPNDRGAALYAPGSSLTVRNATFRSHSVSGFGAQIGAVYFAGGSPLVEDTRFEENVALGVVYDAGGAPVLRRVTFVGGVGHGVYFDAGSAGLVEDALFEQNTGQGAFVEASGPVFRRSTFRDNVTTLSPTDGAGAFIDDGGAPLFEDCLFEDLRTRDDLSGLGGGVHVEADGAVPRPAFVRTTFRNSTANQGGGATTRPADALFLWCHFEGNRALSGGGFNGFTARVSIIGSLFVGNRAEPGISAGFGGAVRLTFPPLVGGRSLVANTVFAGNAARRGGAVALEASGVLPVDLVNVTFAGNAASELGGGLQVFNAGDVALRNAVLWGNEAPEGPEVHVTAGAGPTVERAIVAGGCPDGATCTDVLDADPRFLREPSPGPDGAWGTEDDDYGDLALSALSPGLDAGLTEYLPPDTWDLDGDGDTAEPLPLDAVGAPRIEGAEVDLGAYERAAPAVRVEAHSAADVPLIPAGGGEFAFTVRLVNGTSEPQTVEAGVAATLPDGSAYGPFRSRAVTVPAGGEVVARLVQTVPGAAPSGLYEFVVFTGSWPDSLRAADAFGFRKAPGAARGRPVGGGWSLDVESVEEAEGAPAPVTGEPLAVSVAPNPARGTAAVSLGLPRAGEVSVALYDGLGRRVAVLHGGWLDAGRHEVALDASGLPPGVYVVRVRAGEQVRTARVTVVR